MCGICGIVQTDGAEPIDRRAFEAMTDVLAHRGPDGRGFHFDDHAALGHRRLSIIDLAGGHQPMYNEDGALAIVFNGEIYNYLELRPELIRRGHRLRTSSDTEVILHLYEDLGPDCVQHLNGMFAFAIWNARDRSLFLARDRLGEKPLYYRVDEARLTFASEVKAILQAPGTRPELNPEALDAYLAYGYVPEDLCIIEGVRKLPPGCSLFWKDGRARIEPYWDVLFAEGNVPDEGEWMEELERRLRASIRIRLRSDVPLGVFLSGGVDSSAMVALASRECAGRLKTFSVGFEDADFSEVMWARRVAQQYGTEHQEIVVTDHDLSVLPSLAYHLDEPFADPSALPTFYVCREARRFVTVCLSGDGGDEVFAGYTRYAQAQRYERMDRFTRVGVRQLCGLMAGAVPRHLPGSGLMQRVGSEGADRWFGQCGKFTASERAALLRPEAGVLVREEPWLFERFFEQAEAQDLVSTLQHADQKTYLPDDILVKVDRMSMKNSLEVRVPLLDHTLVEFANASPASFKIRNGVTKHLLKRMLEAHLPPDLLHRPKRGFGLPIRRWFRSARNGFVRDALTGADARLHRWIKPQEVAKTVADHERGGRDLSEKVWALLMLELWCRAYGV